MGPFKSLGHIALRVRDLDKSVDFYTKLGYPEFLRLTRENGETWIVYMRMADDLYIELFPGGPKDQMNTPPEHTGVTHLSVMIDDADKAEEHLKKVGIPLMRPRNPGRSLDRNRGMWVEDPDGNRIEIMEMAPNCIQFEAIRDFHKGKPPHVLKLYPGQKPTA